MRLKFLVVTLGLLLGAALLSAQARKTLDIYVVDVEGGNATLFVTPAGESVLIDAGNGGAAAARDAARIFDAVKDAGITQIDHHITTHWHGDHFGGLEELAKLVPIRAYYDHGDTVQPQPASTEFLQKVYPQLVARARRVIVKPGDRIPLKGVDWRIVASGGQVLQTNLPGAGQRNPYCANFKLQDPDPTENAQSVGSFITFGKFRVAHPGDLTWNKEGELMCPNNRLGTVDLLIVGHHGQPVSNSEVIVHALRPRVSIMNNGTRKGGQPPAMQIILNSPGLEDVWQSHFSLLSGTEYTVPGMFIGNTFDDEPEALPKSAWTPPPQGQQAPPAPAHNGKAFWFKVSAQQDGTFSVVNTRNNFTKTYRAGE
ncbi:MAG: MBL fold metallo-hydrolase [Acidobacteria bacterium]|nr:MBL fold metallo-hydrolase [Acidobacteriota bacterium]